MLSQQIAYEADGLRMHSQLFCEAGGQRRPGILVFPETFGLGDHALSRAESLARMGYVALACDLHGERRSIPDLGEVMSVIWQMNVYGGVVHSFTNPDADKAGRPEQLRYDAKADAPSRLEMRALFDEVFGRR
jgi:dienelactone hydrolase